MANVNTDSNLDFDEFYLFFRFLTFRSEIELLMEKFGTKRQIPNAIFEGEDEEILTLR